MLDRIAEFFIFGLVPLVVGVFAVPELTSAAEKTLAGEVTYRERIALPRGAVLSIELADISRADAPAIVIGKRRIVLAGQVPVRFELGFDPKAIRADKIYALQARIVVDGRLMFVTQTRHQVDPLAGKPQTVVLKTAPATEPGAAGLYDQSWLVEYIDGIGAIAEPQATFRISEAGKAGGKGPCNTYFTTAKVDGDKIAISDIGSTRMACAPDVMAQERALFDALAKAASYKIDAGKLIIADEGGRDILRFNAAS